MEKIHKSLFGHFFEISSYRTYNLKHQLESQTDGVTDGLQLHQPTVQFEGIIPNIYISFFNFSFIAKV